jgi:hypothetical protein
MSTRHWLFSASFELRRGFAKSQSDRGAIVRGEADPVEEIPKAQSAVYAHLDKRGTFIVDHRDTLSNDHQSKIHTLHVEQILWRDMGFDGGSTFQLRVVREVSPCHEKSQK